MSSTFQLDFADERAQLQMFSGLLLCLLDVLRLALNRFHEHHGAHSGATHTCLGRKRMIMRSNSIWPSNVDRSPCSLVNRVAFPLALVTSSAKRLSGWAYTSSKSIIINLDYDIRGVVNH